MNGVQWHHGSAGQPFNVALSAATAHLLWMFDKSDHKSVAASSRYARIAAHIVLVHPTTVQL
jgi:hypothetical protein